MQEFEPLKALKEEINGLVDIKTALARKQQQLQIQFGELEVELNSVMKLRGFADAEIDRKRRVLKNLEDEHGKT